MTTPQFVLLYCQPRAGRLGSLAPSEAALVPALPSSSLLIAEAFKCECPCGHLVISALQYHSEALEWHAALESQQLAADTEVLAFPNSPGISFLFLFPHFGLNYDESMLHFVQVLGNEGWCQRDEIRRDPAHTLLGACCMLGITIAARYTLFCIIPLCPTWRCWGSGGEEMGLGAYASAGWSTGIPPHTPAPGACGPRALCFSA